MAKNDLYATTRIKVGSKEDAKFLERGDIVTVTKVGSKESMTELIDTGVLVTAAVYDVLFPEDVQVEAEEAETETETETAAS